LWHPFFPLAMAGVMCFFSSFFFFFLLGYPCAVAVRLPFLQAGDEALRCSRHPSSLLPRCASCEILFLFHPLISRSLGTVYRSLRFNYDLFFSFRSRIKPDVPRGPFCYSLPGAFFSETTSVLVALFWGRIIDPRRRPRGLALSSLAGSLQHTSPSHTSRSLW